MELHSKKILLDLLKLQEINNNWGYLQLGYYLKAELNATALFSTAPHIQQVVLSYLHKKKGMVWGFNEKSDT